MRLPCMSSKVESTCIRFDDGSGVPERSRPVGCVSFPAAARLIWTRPILRSPAAARDGSKEPPLPNGRYRACKFGSPLHRIVPVYDEKANTFTLPESLMPLPLFPLEGMFTRVPGSGDGEPNAFIETPTPSLLG